MYEGYLGDSLRALNYRAVAVPQAGWDQTEESVDHNLFGELKATLQEPI